MRKIMLALAVIASAAAVVPAGARALSLHTAAQRTRVAMYHECSTFDRRVFWIVPRGECMDWGAHSCHHVYVAHRGQVRCWGWYEIHNSLPQRGLGRGYRFCERIVDVYRLGNTIRAHPFNGMRRKGRECFDPSRQARRGF